MGNYLTAQGKQQTAEAIMEIIGGRRDHGAAFVAKALAKKLSSSELETFLHVARNPARPKREPTPFSANLCLHPNASPDDEKPEYAHCTDCSATFMTADLPVKQRRKRHQQKGLT